ncbi:hypothetical protein VST7929_00572 [Vibrio stylophorae]|uniref:Uncharacterized protein n=1 Tax=Vibrio stylophorae TaxID=659351 RepID=A0ABN8DQ50_9VIBR|nr:AhpA/YtjB family protein [Vibrio stylophorae]CAH0532727.1 hypothetical protein VST7929_00572 [Vibrio stylophorae]
MRSVQIKWQQAMQYIVLALSLAGISMMMASTHRLNQQNMTQIDRQTELLSQVLVQQAADSVAQSVVNDDPEQLQVLLNQLSKSPYIYDAAVYDLSGVPLAQSSEAKSVTELTGLATPLGVASMGRKQWVSEIKHQNERVGFVRITLEQGKLVAPAQNKLQTHIDSLRVMLVFAIIIGIVLAVTFYSQKRWLRSPFHMRPAPLKHRKKRKLTPIDETQNSTSDNESAPQSDTSATIQAEAASSNDGNQLQATKKDNE